MAANFFKLRVNVEGSGGIYGGVSLKGVDRTCYFFSLKLEGLGRCWHRLEAAETTR